MSNLSINLVIIESDSLYYEKLKKLLNELKDINLQVNRVKNGIQALSYNYQNTDLIIFSDKSKKNDIISFLKTTSHPDINLPVILINNKLSNDDDIQYLRAGASDFLSRENLKPIFLHRSIIYSLERKSNSQKKIQIKKQELHNQKQVALGELATLISNSLENSLNKSITLLKDHTEKDSNINEAIELLKQAQIQIDHIQACSSSGEEEFEKVYVLQDIVIETINFLKTIFPKKISLLVSTSKKASDTEIFCNRQQVRQAIINLVINSREAIPSKGNIQFSFNIKENVISLNIKDNGIGILPNHLDKIFEHNFSTKHLSGLGLGLPAVFSIMKHHKGWVNVESKIGVGTTFSLNFKIYSKTDKTPFLNKGNILLISSSNNNQNKKLNELYFNAAGFKVKEYSKSEEALIWYSNNTKKTNYIILDKEITDLDPISCIHSIKNLNPKSNIILLESESENDTENEIDKRLLFKTVKKPIDYTYIISLIN